MAEILIKSNLFSPSCPHLPCFSFSPKNSSPSSVSGFSSLKLQPLRSSSNSDFHGQRIFLQQVEREPIRGNLKVVSAQMGLIGKSHKWWEKGLQSNMKDITSAQDLVDSLLNAGDKLVIIDFFSPGCGGCKALHPKICQFAEMNPDVQFLKVNYEELKCMCYSLNVHVLPFFRFYRGAHGRLCSFSCTNATIKKFKDALAKHTTDRCSLGPPKGLEESELLALAAKKELSFNYIPKVPLVQEEEKILEPIPANLNFNLPSISKVSKDSEEKSLVAAGR